MEKITFLNNIQRHLGLKLTTSQFNFLFTSNKYVVMTTPRAGGKTFIASMDALSTCTIPNKEVIIITSSNLERSIIQDYICKAVVAIKDNIAINIIDHNQISFSNGSTIHFKSELSDFRGYKINKAIISEPDFIKDIEELISKLEICLAMSEDAQIKLIGSHLKNRYNLIAYMLNPYYDKIQMTYRENPFKFTKEQEMKLEKLMDSISYQLEIKNEITPKVFMNLLHKKGR